MTDLELFAKATLEQGGVWRLIRQDGELGLYQSNSKYMLDGRYIHYLNPVYQIFKNGNRIFASTNFFEAFQAYKKEFNKQEGE